MSLEDNKVFIGNKPLANYILAVQTQLNNGNKEVSIEARGRAISTAVDVVEVMKRRFGPIKTGQIEIGSEERESKIELGKKANVSTIKIVVSKQ